MKGEKMKATLPPEGNEFWSKPARDMAQILIAFGNYDRQELLNRLINKVTVRNKRVQERHVLQVASEMYNGQQERGLDNETSTD